MPRKQRALAGVVILAAAGAGYPQTGQGAQRPSPIAAAIMLLGWRGGDVPHIEVVDAKPADASPTVEGWVRFNADGSALPIVYISADTYVYRDAAGQDYQALVKLAGILAHERWHLRHGRDEVGAYTAQLSTMEYLHANAMHLADVRRALQRVALDGKN